MREVVLEKIAKEELIKEYGESAVKIDCELNELAKLVIKRKDFIKAFNTGNFSAKKRYMEVMEKIKKIVAEINKKI